MNPTPESHQDQTDLPTELRPVRFPFLFQRVVPFAAIIVLVTIGASIGVSIAEPPTITAVHVAVLGVAVLAVWVLVAGFLAHVAYTKERYEFYDHRIVAHAGSLVSDRTTELLVRNITHVKRRLPWPRYPLFGVGDVMIESAGSDASEVTLRTIRQPVEVYERVADLMRDNGFQLSREQLLHEEQPDRLAVSIECLGMAAAAVVATILTAAEFALEREEGPNFGLYLSMLPLLGIIAVVFHYLDMRRRTYRVYNDTVMYEEGFLTRDDAFIPGENIADSSTRRGLIDLILGLYDVRVSCQGSKGEIQFRRLRGGSVLSSAIEQAAANTKSGLPRSPGLSPAVSDMAVAELADDAESTAATALPLEKPTMRPVLPELSERWTAELRPSVWRAVAPFIVLCAVVPPLVPIWVAAIIRGLIVAACTRYSVRPNSVQERFQFLHSTEREFQGEKITGAVVRENPFDRILGTLTVSIWSIGSGRPLELAHVERKSIELDRLLRQLGIPASEPVDEIPSRFSLPRMTLATIPWQVFWVIAILTIVVLAIVLSPWILLALSPLALVIGGAVGYCFLYYPRSVMTIHAGHFECRQGWLWRQRYYVRFDNVKRVEIVKYPRVDVGSVQIVAAGEFRPGSSSSSRKKSKQMETTFQMASYGFQIRYIEQISRCAWALDERLQGKQPGSEPLDREVEHETGAAIANPLAALIPLSIIFVPLLVLLPVTLTWTIVAVRRRRYIVEPHRLVLKSGVIYRRQSTILHDRIDTIRRNQQLLGKLFGNGSVTVFTAGSSQPDLKYTNAPDYRQLYEMLQQHYQHDQRRSEDPTS